jgi:hypothetical protein
MGWSSFEVAGWEDSSGNWRDETIPGDSISIEQARELEESDQIVLHIYEDNGDDRFVTVSYPTEDYWLDDYLDDAYSEEGDYAAA